MKTKWQTPQLQNAIPINGHKQEPQHLQLSQFFPICVSPWHVHMINMCAFRTLAMSWKRSTITRIRPRVHLPRTFGNYDTQTKGWATTVTYDLSLFSHDSRRLDEKLTCVESQSYAIRQVVCGQYTKHWKALSITTQKKKKLRHTWIRHLSHYTSSE
jgi:hypothetical protein